jgi:hypothetical protein
MSIGARTIGRKLAAKSKGIANRKHAKDVIEGVIQNSQSTIINMAP